MFANAVVAALLYAGLLQFVRKHAAMLFAVISAISFVATLIPDFTYIPTIDGASNAEIGALVVVMHAIAVDGNWTGYWDRQGQSWCQLRCTSEPLRGPGRSGLLRRTSPASTPCAPGPQLRCASPQAGCHSH